MCALRFLAGSHATIVKLLNKVIDLTFPTLSRNCRSTAHDRPRFNASLHFQFSIFNNVFFSTFFSYCIKQKIQANLYVRAFLARR